MQQWEYKIIDTSPSECIPLQELNELGSDGWQVCGQGRFNLLLKRPIGPDWKARCEAAEAHIIDPGTDTYNKWQEIKNKQI